LIWLRRICQLVSLGGFIALLIAALNQLALLIPENFFLRLDPLIFLGVSISARSLALSYIPALVVIASGPFLGRAFCGYVCPMGTTLEGGKFLVKARRDKSALSKYSAWKYLLLILILFAAFTGVSLVFLASPISLITRLYTVVFIPLATFLGEFFLWAVQPLAEHFDWSGLIYMQIKPRYFATAAFVAAFFGALLIFARISPRLWCRCLCPAGALLSLTSFKPLLRRRVSEACSDCGRCQRLCPMQAIPADPRQTSHQECLLCARCQKACPEGAISYWGKTPDRRAAVSPYLPNRRQVVVAGAVGLATGLLSVSSLAAVSKNSSVARGTSDFLVRPPGALPEKEFLARCMRCAQCSLACPTNILQPTWLDLNLADMFSPGLDPRLGPCDPRCTKCAEACPTGAIRELTKEERLWAKVGTAVIVPNKCLAWEHNKKCMICDEVCPFGAIEMVKAKDIAVPVPKVLENRCTGCGYCAHHCPIRPRPAIVVTAQGALRLATGSYIETGKRQGLSISLKKQPAPGRLPADKSPSSLPPAYR
jgi:MauM/NapG family ferredoxin protein